MPASLVSLAQAPARVAILGGGVAGLTCAHELARHGVGVDLFEASRSVGGKARSQFVPGTGQAGRRDLPGEHGFRFYPAFYRHVIATMQEIHDPLSPTRTVAGNLVSAPEAAVAMGAGVVTVPRRPRTAAEIIRSLQAIGQVGGSARDLARYLGAHLRYLTSSDGRRDGEIDALSWESFIGADRQGRYTDAFKDVLLACTRTMVAMDARRGSSRTIGRASSLLLTDSIGRADVDRTMMGPTTDCWLDPWSEQLQRWGVNFQFERPVVRLELEHGRVARVWTRGPEGAEIPVQADAYVLAVPLEVAARLMSPALADADPSLRRLGQLDMDALTDWMVGAQFFLREDVPLCEGHLFFPRSPWSLTAISQAQFWNRGARSISCYGDGRLAGILSVDVSSCFTPDADGVRLVDETSRQGILRRILHQILVALDPATRRKLEGAVYAAHLDSEVQIGPHGVTNAARLLVHPPGSWAQRPASRLAVPNLFLAGDYVRTAVDLASMEGANEAGRQAAQGVLDLLAVDGPAVKLFPLEPPDQFRRMRSLDARLHSAGLPHLFTLVGNWLRSDRSQGSGMAGSSG